MCILAAGTGSGANSNQQQSYLDPIGLTLGVNGAARMRSYFMGTEFLLGIIKNLLELDSGDGCITLQMYLMHRIVHLKIVKIANFMLCIFNHK